MGIDAGKNAVRSVHGMQLSEVLIYSKELPARGSFLHKQFKDLIEKRNLIVHGH